MSQQETRTRHWRAAVQLTIDEIGDGADIVALGEMGIGNTASSALIVHRLAPAPLDDCIGQGAGQDEAGMARKRAAIAKAAARSSATAPLDVLAEFGGLRDRDDGGRGARRRSRAAAGHHRRIYRQRGRTGRHPTLSCGARLLHVRASLRREAATRSCCAALGAKPLLDLGLRLGEGTGAMLAVPLVRAAARLLTDVADLSDVLAGNL